MTVCRRSLSQLGLFTTLLCSTFLAASEPPLKVETILTYENRDRICQVNCAEAEEILIPKTISRIGRFCFSNRVPCTTPRLKYVRLEQGSQLHEIGQGAFFGTPIEWIGPGLHSPRSHPSLVNCIQLGTQCFSHTKLNSHLRLQGVRTIGKGAFSRSSLPSISIDSTCEKIDDDAFHEADHLTKCVVEDADKGRFIFKSRLISIGKRAFLGTQLAGFSLPASVKTIDDEAFAGCPLLDLSFGSRLTTLGHRCFAQTALRTVVLPASLLVVPRGCFTDCRHLQTVCFARHSLLEAIEEHAFADHAGNNVLCQVTLPASIQRLAPNAFEYQSNVTVMMEGHLADTEALKNAYTGSVAIQ